MITRNLKHLFLCDESWSKYKFLIPEIEKVAKAHQGRVVPGSRCFDELLTRVTVTVEFPTEILLIEYLKKVECLFFSHGIKNRLIGITDPSKEKIINMIKSYESKNPVPVW